MTDLETLVRDLHARVRALEEVRGSALARNDRDRLARLLPVWAAVFGSTAVTSREVITHPNAGLHLVLDGIGARALGKLARRARGVPVAGGLLLARVGTEAGAALWSVRAVVS